MFDKNCSISRFWPDFGRRAQRNVQPFLWWYIREYYIITVDQGLLHTYVTDKDVTCTITANAELLGKILRWGVRYLQA